VAFFKASGVALAGRARAIFSLRPAIKMMSVSSVLAHQKQDPMFTRDGASRVSFSCFPFFLIFK
jgi:hypothetical protein